MSRFNNPVPDYTNNSGTLLANGLLYFYESGTNTTKITYADVNETIANTQPLVLNGDGSVPNCFFSGSAKVILADADDVQQWERDPVTSTESSSFGDTWDSVSIYSLNEVVTFNGILYVSIIASNQNQNPSSVPAAWTQFDLLKRWNASETYAVRDPVIASDYSIYVSLSNGNIGNNPVTDGGVNWQATGLGASTVIPFADWDLSVDYAVGGKNIVTGSDGNYYVSLQTPNLNQDPTSATGYWVLFYVDGRNLLINSNFSINQRVWGGGQPSAGVYGYDRWKGDVLGTRIEQVVENTTTYNESFVISWTGGTGTADVDGTTGLSSGDAFTLNTSANFSVIVPTDATDIKLERGVFKTPYTTQGSSIAEELALCQRYYYAAPANDQRPRYRCTSIPMTLYRPPAIYFPVTMRATPSVNLVAVTSTNSTNETVFASASAGFTVQWDEVAADTITGPTFSYTADAEI